MYHSHVKLTHYAYSTCVVLKDCYIALFYLLMTLFKSRAHSIFIADVYVPDSDLDVSDHGGNQLLHKSWVLAGLLI